MHRNQWYSCLLFAWAIATVGTPSIAQPFFETVRGGAYRTNKTRIDYVRPVDRLFEGDRLENGRTTFCFLIDFRAGAVCAEPYSELRLERIRRDARGCIDEKIRFDGELTTAINPFTCPTSRLYFVAPNDAVFSITGTRLNLQSEDQDAKVIVYSGGVTARQQKAVVNVPPGFGAIVIGQNAPILVKIDWAKSFVVSESRGIYEGQINPLNTLLLNGEKVQVSADGSFSAPIANRGNGDIFTVVDSLGNRRSYDP